MTKKLVLDYKYRVRYKFIELNKNIIKLFYLNKHLDYKVKFYVLYLLSKYKKNNSFVRNKNYCVLTARSHGVYSFFSLSRIFLKGKGSFGYVPGLRKSSW